jgi:hypothetical protein
MSGPFFELVGRVVAALRGDCHRIIADAYPRSSAASSHQNRIRKPNSICLACRPLALVA